VALLFLIDHRADVNRQILVRSAFAKERAQVVIVLAEKAGAQLAVGG
jgi:hypothetical protein